MPRVAHVDGPAFAQADDDNRGGIDDGHGEEEHGHEDREVRTAGARHITVEEEDGGKDETDEVTAAVAQEDGGRVEVESEETDQDADEGQGEGGDEVFAGRERVHE